MIPISAVSILSLAVIAISACADLCGNDVIARLPCPDGVHDAVIYERDCGATTGFSTQVTLPKAGAALPKTPTPITVIDSDHGRAPAGPGGGPVIDATWLAPDSLLLRFDTRARVFQQRRRAGRVVIQYDSIVAGGA